MHCVVRHAKTTVLLLHQMINNDISYVFKDLPYPYQGTKEEARSLIKSLLNEHLNESVAAPFFNEADDLDCLREELPEGWNIELEEESRQAKSTLRVVVYNKYDEADRSTGEDFENVTLKATNLYGYTWVISSVEVEDEDCEELPLELYSAEGESPVCIILYGGEDEEIYADFDELDIAFKDDGTVEISEESLDQVVSEICS